MFVSSIIWFLLVSFHSMGLRRACGHGAVLSLCMVRPGSGRFGGGFWVGFWVELRARDFPTERVLSRTPLIIRTVDQKNDTHNTQHTTHNNKISRSCTDCRDKRGRYVAERETRDEGRGTSHIARAYSIYLEHISPTSPREIPRLSSSIADTHTQPLKRKQQKNRTIPYYLPSGPIK